MAQSEAQALRKTRVRPVGPVLNVLRDAWQKKHLYLLLLPMLVFLLVFSWWPAIQAVRYAFLNFDGVDSSWVGVANFGELLSDPIARMCALNSVKLALFGISIGVWVPLFVAELMFFLKKASHQYAYRVLFVIPMVVPFVALMLVWQFIYEPNHGVINTILDGLGLGALGQAWLGQSNIALYSIMGVGFPWVTPLYLLLYFAALQGISEDIIDASKTDGCSGIRRIFSVDIPLVIGQVKVVTMLELIAAVEHFVKIMILTDGGPGNATMVPGLYMYRNAFAYYRMGYASALGVVLIVIVLILTYINMSQRQSDIEYIAH